MSYTMDFESKVNMKPEDSVMELNGFTIGEYYKNLPPPLSLDIFGHAS